MKEAQTQEEVSTFSLSFVAGNVVPRFPSFKAGCFVSKSCQRAKKVVSDIPGLVDFAIGLVNPVLNLPTGQGEIQITEEL